MGYNKLLIRYQWLWTWDTYFKYLWSILFILGEKVYKTIF